MFAPFLWLIKIIIEHFTQAKQLQFQKEENEKNRIHELKKQKNELEYKRFEQEEKTKRLEMALEYRREIAEAKLQNNNPNLIDTWSILRRNKKGRKTR